MDMKFVLLYVIYSSAFIFLASALPFVNGNVFNRITLKVQSIDGDRHFVDDSIPAVQTDYVNPESNSDDEDEPLSFYPRMKSIAFDDNDGDLPFSTVGDSVGATHSNVAFTAFLDHIVYHLNNQALVFNQIIYNAGAAYNQHTGVFTVPIGGTYMFSFHFEDWETRDDIIASLMVDSVNMADSVIHPQGLANQAGNTVVLGMRAGQSVWVRAKGKSVWGGPSHRFTVFTGVLIN